MERNCRVLVFPIFSSTPAASASVIACSNLSSLNWAMSCRGSWSDTTWPMTATTGRASRAAVDELPKPELERLLQQDWHLSFVERAREPATGYWL